MWSSCLGYGDTLCKDVIYAFTVTIWAVVQVVQTAKTRDGFLALYLRNIWLLATKNDISLHIKHIEGHNNSIDDALSRLPTGNLKFHNKIHELDQELQWHSIGDHHFLLDLSI